MSTRSSILTRSFSTAGGARRISHEGAQRLHGMAGAYDEAPDGAENCRERAERFDIIARYRILRQHERKIMNGIKTPPFVPSSSSGLALRPSKDSERIFRKLVYFL